MVECEGRMFCWRLRGHSAIAVRESRKMVDVLLCRAHNHWLARKDFGNSRIDEAIAQGRRSTTTSELSPGKAQTAPENTTVPVLNPG